MEVRTTTAELSALDLVKALKAAGHAAYFVGGAVRDMLRGERPKDIDLATSARPDEVLALFPDGQRIGAAFGIINVVVAGRAFEIASFRRERRYEDGRHPEDVQFTDDPELDAQRRDFTVNGMFYDPVTETLLDFVGGRADLARGILRTIGVPAERFAEDYLRLLRAVRFAVQLGFELENETATAIAKFADSASCLAAERVREELEKMWLSPNPARALQILLETGLLRVLLPEIADLDGVPQPKKYHPEGDVLTHTKLMLERMCRPDADLAWAVLLHDVGKPATFSVDNDGIEHFYCHDRVSAKMAGRILERLRCPKTRIKQVVTAVANHMRYGRAAEMRAAKWRRLLAAPSFSLELELHRVDCASSHNRMDNFLFLLDRSLEFADKPVVPEPLLNGHDLIALGISPGPRMGKILRHLADLQLEGKLQSREDAVKFVRSRKAPNKQDEPI